MTRRLFFITCLFLGLALFMAAPAFAGDAPGLRATILGIIAQPNVTFLLITLGSYGLIYEVLHPGALFPGVTGSVCLLLALYALGVMPVNYAGAALMLLGVTLMTAEAFVVSFGILGLGGAVSFAAGGVFLFDSDVPGYGVDPWLIGFVTLVSVGVLSVVLAVVLKAQRRKPVTGKEELIGAIATVLHWSGGAGEVRVTGEVWQAACEGPAVIQNGDKVEVTRIEGLRLFVAPATREKENP